MKIYLHMDYCREITHILLKYSVLKQIFLELVGHEYAM